MTIQFSKFGTHLGTRVLGEEVRNLICQKLTNNQKLCFDFQGIESISNSFADESFAKLLMTFDFNYIKTCTHFINTNEFVSSIISVAFKNRLKELSISQ
jgi:hypothetical protein